MYIYIKWKTKAYLDTVTKQNNKIFASSPRKWSFLPVTEIYCNSKSDLIPPFLGDGVSQAYLIN